MIVFGFSLNHDRSRRGDGTSLLHINGPRYNILHFTGYVNIREEAGDVRYRHEFRLQNVKYQAGDFNVLCGCISKGKRGCLETRKRGG